MRLSTMPFGGTVSAATQRENKTPYRANAAARILLLLMVGLLRDRLVDENLGLGAKIHDLESQRIPTARFRVLRGLGIGELNSCNPVSERLLGSGALASSLQVAYLGKIGQPAGAGEETHRIDLYAHRAAILVHVEGRRGIRGSPKRVPSLISLRRVKGPALLIVAFRRCEIEALTYGQIVGQEIPGHSLFGRRAPGVHRHHIDDARTVVDPYYEGIDPLQRHEQTERACTRYGTNPTGSGYPPCGAGAAAELHGPIRVP